MKKYVGLLFVLLLAATPAFAQTITVGFTPSADHSLQDYGVNRVDRYELRISVTTADGTVIVTNDLGKPTPQTAGCEVGEASCIILDKTALFKALQGGRSYNVRVAAIGPGGAGVSTPFVWTPPLPGTPTAPGSIRVKVQ